MREERKKKNTRSDALKASMRALKAACILIVVVRSVPFSARKFVSLVGYWAEHGNLPKKDCALNACLCSTFTFRQ